jgi:hypothetical protein
MHCHTAWPTLLDVLLDVPPDMLPPSEYLSVVLTIEPGSDPGQELTLRQTLP